MKKFKVGDKVRILVDDWIGVPLHCIGIITEVSNHRSYFIKNPDNNHHLWFTEDEFEHAPIETMLFKRSKK